MTVDMAARVTKVKEEIEDTKPDFLHHSSQKLHEGDAHETSKVRIKEEGDILDNVCHGCGQSIHDQWLLKVSDQSGNKYWHAHCLRCSCCHIPLNDDTSCFLKYGQVLCKADYIRLYCTTNCSKCCHPINQSDWIRKARDQVRIIITYHRELKVLFYILGFSSCMFCL